MDMLLLMVSRWPLQLLLQENRILMKISSDQLMDAPCDFWTSGIELLTELQ
jgi:hypothetical protein